MFWLVTWRFCVIREEPELFSGIRDYTTLFYVSLRGKSSEWLESSMQSDLGMWFPRLSHSRFCYFETLFQSENRSLKTISYLFSFVIQENEIFISVILYLFPFVTRARDPLYEPQTILRQTEWNIFVLRVHIQYPFSTCNISPENQLSTQVMRKETIFTGYGITSLCSYFRELRKLRRQRQRQGRRR